MTEVYRCGCGRARRGRYTADQCPDCWLEKNDPRRNRACVHLGEKVRIPGQVRDWRVCKLGLGLGPDRKTPGVTCFCKRTPVGCVKCPSYEPGDVG